MEVLLPEHVAVGVGTRNPAVEASLSEYEWIFVVGALLSKHIRKFYGYVGIRKSYGHVGIRSFYGCVGGLERFIGCVGRKTYGRWAIEMRIPGQRESSWGTGGVKPPPGWVCMAIQTKGSVSCFRPRWSEGVSERD